MVQKTWPEWLEYWKAVASELPRLDVPPEFRPQATQAEWEKVFDELERLTRVRVDEACSHFVANNEWPTALDIRERWFAGLRVHHAMQLSLFVLPSLSGVPAIVWADHLDDVSAARWMLVDAWLSAGGFWKSKIAGMAGEKPDAFRRLGRN